MEVATARVAQRLVCLAKPAAICTRRLLVATLHEGHHVGILLERLPDAGHIAMTEYPQSRRDEPPAHAVGLGVLVGEI